MMINVLQLMSHMTPYLLSCLQMFPCVFRVRVLVSSLGGGDGYLDGGEREE